MAATPEDPLPVAHLPRAARELVRILRVIAYFLGRNFSEEQYDEIAIACGLPRRGLVAKAFGGSFVWARVAAGVGDLPRGLIPPKPFRLKGWHLKAADEELVGGMALGVRLHGCWEPVDQWDLLIAKPARKLGYPVPYRSQIRRRLESWAKARAMTEALLQAQLGANAPDLLLPPLSASERVAGEMADARERLGFYSKYDDWNRETRPFRKAGMKVPVMSKIMRHFESYEAAKARAEEIRRERLNG